MQAFTNSKARCETLEDYKSLDNNVKDYFGNSLKTPFLFMDEIQEIDKWEKAIISYFAEGNYDIYITGSNSNLLSSELSTYISGRYVEINIFTFGLDEFQDFRKNKRQLP